MPKPKTTHTGIWVKTHRRLNRLAARREASLVQTLDKAVDLLDKATQTPQPTTTVSESVP